MVERCGSSRRVGQPPDTPEAILSYVGALGIGGAYAVDAPSDPAGEWWIDIDMDGSRAAVAWRPGLGFGL